MFGDWNDYGGLLDYEATENFSLSERAIKFTKMNICVLNKCLFTPARSNTYSNTM